MEESKTQLSQQQQQQQQDGQATSCGSRSTSLSSARPSAASSRRVSVSNAAAACAASPAPSASAPTSGLQRTVSNLKPAGSRPRVPLYEQSIQMLTAALSSAASPAPFVSPFSTSQSLYSITPHETVVLFSPYTAAPHSHLSLSAFHCLLSAFLSSLRGSLSQRELPISALPSSAEAEAALGERLFAELDTDGDGRLDGDDMQRFLQRVDEAIGEQMRRDWKRKVVVSRLQEIAAL